MWLAGGVRAIVADAGGKDGAIGRLGLVYQLDANEVDQRLDDAGLRVGARGKRNLGVLPEDGALVDFALEHCEAVGDAVASEFIVDDGQMALFEGAYAHVGRFVIRAGEEHQFLEAGAQVTLRRDFRGAIRAHEAYLIGGLGKIGEWLAGLVDGWRDHLRVPAGGKHGNEKEDGWRNHRFERNSHGINKDRT